MAVGDDGVAAVHRAMVEVEEALRLAVAHHVAAVGIGARHLRLLQGGLPLLLLQRLLAVGGAVLLDRRVEIVPVVGARLGHNGHVELRLVGVGLEMRRVGIEHRAVDQAGPDRLLDDPVEDRLRYCLVLVAAATVLRQRRGVEHLVGQLEPQKPAVGDVDLDLAHQLPLRTNAEQVADEQRLEHQGRVERRPAVVGAVERRRQVMDEGKVDHPVDLAKQVILRDQLVEPHNLERGLFRGGSLQHDPVNQKPPAKARGLSAV